MGGFGSALLLCGVGLFLGVRHATDADHLVALSTIVSRQRSVGRAAVTGAMWGLGHTITIFLVGSLIILLDVHIPARLGLGMEFCVAIMLVVLGILNLTGLLLRPAAWCRRLFHRLSPHHAVAADITPEKPARTMPLAWARPLAIGLLHGLAGSAAVALLVLSTIPQPRWAVLYLLVFGAGTILGMVSMTTAIALPLTYGAKRFDRLNRHLATVSGVISLCFGLFLVYELGFVGGLFGPHPHWTPS